MNRPSWIGQTLGGRYRIDEILGQGGMSAVYKAYDPNLRRVVAIKLIHTHLADDPRFVSRFEEEAAAVAQLRHPNIVQVFDFNHDHDVYYMVQEFLAGETLQDRLRRLNKSARRLALSEAINITIHICDAAGYAHKRGMIHRDIKPANIMLDVHGQAILMDFGIVKIAGGDKHTATGAVVGTALYLSPELIRGETPDARTDMYALGVTLFEMVNGHPPFEAESAMTLLMMHMNDPVPDLRQLRPEVPEALIAVIEKSLAKDRQQRYSSMEELAAALRAAQAALSGPSNIQATLPDIPAPGQSISASATGSPQLAPTRTPVASTMPDTSSGATPAVGNPATLQATHSQQTLLGNPTSMASDRLPPPTNHLPGTLPPAPLPRGAGRLFLWIGLSLVAVLSIAIVLSMVLSGNKQNGEKIPTLETTQAVAAAPDQATITLPLPEASATPTHTQAPTSTSTTAPTLVPTAIPSPTVTPLPTIPVGVPYVTIKGIGLDSQGNYLVDYETFEYTEELPGQHIHFFFNTVPPEQAGAPAQGSWVVWGGPRPFNRFRQVDRPESATQLCALVANPDHSVRLLSGSCFILPDVNVAAPFEASACLAGPDPLFPAAAQLDAGQLVLVNGLSPDEAWWNVQIPGEPDGSCWLERSQTSFQGDLSTLALVTPPEKPAGTAGSGLSVQITSITLDASNRYQVEYQTSGFKEQLPGIHLHFFFDIFSANQVGATGGGNRLMHGGPSPFSGYTSADRPAGAVQMCVLVANPDHSVIPNSGNCFPLP